MVLTWCSDVLGLLSVTRRCATLPAWRECESRNLAFLEAPLSVPSWRQSAYSFAEEGGVFMHYVRLRLGSQEEGATKYIVLLILTCQPASKGSRVASNGSGV